MNPGALVDALLAGADRYAGCAVHRLAPLPSTVDTSVARPITVDQTHESHVVGERVVVKWYRTPVPARAIEVPAHLVAVGFTGTPACYAALTRDAVPAALVTGYLPEARDGWRWGVADFDEDFGADLGRLVAGLHAALATPSPILARPRRTATREDVAGWARQSRDAVAAALDETGGPDGAWLATVAGRLERDLILPDVVGTPLVRTHGDLHVGQVLRWRDGLRVTDFDGNPTAPERSEWQPAARDVAQLLTSVEHLAAMVAARTGRPDAMHRGTRLRGALLDGYRSGLGATGHTELFEERLLAPFEAEQVCRELSYANRCLPRWRYAPIGVLRDRYR